MKLLDYFPYEPDAEKRELIDRLQGFLDKRSPELFVLTGYAGTGKTTLLKSIVNYCKGKKRNVVLLASTGRAAKILRDKTLHEATTVHQGIYTYTAEENIKGYIRLVFTLRFNPPPADTLFLIDEASMISNRFAMAAFASFGSGKLLDDIFRYLRHNQLIFIGDKGQLPPVNSNFSPALNPEYLLSHYHKNASHYNLTRIQRQGQGSVLLKLVRAFVRKFKNKDFDMLHFSVGADTDDSVQVLPTEFALVEQYCSNLDLSATPNRIMLALSNIKVNELNNMVRHYMFSFPSLLEKNEQLVSFANNYLYDVLNGDSLRLMEWDKNSEVEKAGLHFIKCRLAIRRMQQEQTIVAYLIKEFLTSPKASLSKDDEQKIMIDFAIRMKEQGIKRSDKNLWLDALSSDPFVNALRLRYGYALTVHKSQGGEWDSVFLLFENYFGSFEVEYQHRWAYTAVTRAVKHLYMVFNPYIH